MALLALLASTPCGLRTSLQPPYLVRNAATMPLCPKANTVGAALAPDPSVDGGEERGDTSGAALDTRSAPRSRVADEVSCLSPPLSTHEFTQTQLRYLFLPWGFRFLFLTISSRLMDWPLGRTYWLFW